MQSTDIVHFLEIQAAEVDISPLEELSAALGYVCSTFRDFENGITQFRIFAEDAEDAALIKDAFVSKLALWTNGVAIPSTAIQVRSMEKEDWSETWKQHFHTFRASRRLVVKPSWESYAAAACDIVLEVDPGMCFGTGYHGTTRACLEFMDDLNEELGEVSFLEAGCGSGILSIAAAKLGYRPILAFDHDPDAVCVTQENLENAGIEDVVCNCANVAEYAPESQCRVVAANILAEVLSENAATIAGWVKRGQKPGYLLLAGTLTEQYEAVRNIYTCLGFRELRTRTIDEWTSGCLVNE